MRYDCIIIGGGPAGAFCAQKTAEHGLDTLLLEKDARNRYKSCAGGITLRAIEWLSGITSDVCQQSAKIELHSPNSYYRNPDENVYGGQKGVMVYRTIFDQWLRDTAEKKGVCVMYNAEVTDIQRTPTASHVSLENSETYRTDCVVVAAGMNIPFLRKIGLDVPECVVAIQREWALDEPAVEERFGDWAVLSFNSLYTQHGYAWAFPKKDGVSVGVVTRPHSASNLVPALNEYCTKDPHIAPKLEGSQEMPIGDTHFSGHLIPIQLSQTTYRDRMLVIGDAGGFTDPFAFEGISYAFHSGALAASILKRAAQINDYSVKTLATFQQRWTQEIYEPWWKYSHLMAKALYDHSDMDMMLDNLLTLAQTNPEIGRGLSDMTSGYVDHRTAYQKIMSQKTAIIKALGIIKSMKLYFHSTWL